MSVSDRRELHAAVQHDLNRSSAGEKFSPALEAHYVRDTNTARSLHLCRAGLLGLALFDAFQIADVHLTPDVLRPLILFHLICTVIYGGVLAATWLGGNRRGREAAHAICFILALTGTILLSCSSRAPERSYICITYVLFVFFVNVIIRLRWMWCLTFSACAVLFATPAILVYSGMPDGVKQMAALSVIGSALLSLYTAYGLEAAERRNYLLTLDQGISAEELADSNVKLSALSSTDWLTGTANRRGLELHLADAWMRATAAGAPVCLLMIDVDFFKLFNDQYGHPAGDSCLATLAALIAQQLREKLDRLGRYGGEEFAVVMPDTTLDDAVAAAERIRQAVEDFALPHSPHGKPAVVTVSIGAAMAWPANGDTQQQLILAADQALYECKTRGRNRVHPPVLARAWGGAAPETPPSDQAGPLNWSRDEAGSDAAVVQTSSPPAVSPD
jgi:diguanylate cyclase (GGDEF)-like protein